MVAEIKKRILDKFGSNTDLHLQVVQLSGMELEIVGLSSLVDVPATVLRLTQIAPEAAIDWEQLKKVVGEVEAQADLVQGLLEGRSLLLGPDGKDAVWIKSESMNLNRTVSTPNNYNVMAASQTAFIEDISTNLGLVRNELRTANLMQAMAMVGSIDKKRILVLSVASAADPAFVAYCLKALKTLENKPVDSLRQVMSCFVKQPIWNPMPSYVGTESPHQAAYYLRRGRVVLLIEGNPEAIVIPVQLSDLFISSEDRNYTAVISAMLVAFRILGSIIAIAAPAAYVALVSVNPDVMKVELIFTIAQSRVGVPYPSITESLILLFIIEMLFEAIIRLPKSIGPAVTMVGGIILGQAVVEANLVSNLLIIVLAASTISNFTIINYHFALVIRLWKYVMLCLASMFGPIGIVCGFYLLMSLISSAAVKGKPFVPITPLDQKEKSH